jgi:hypothetical protein
VFGADGGLTSANADDVVAYLRSLMVVSNQVPSTDCSAMDGGADAAKTDAGTDAPADVGVDAPAPADSGIDAPADAGMDAGSDADDGGSDAADSGTG